MKKYLINLANLHVGGGVQVAVSLIDDLTKSNLDIGNIEIWLSSIIEENLINIGTDLSCFSSVRVINLFGIRTIFKFRLTLIFAYNFKAVLTLFGPSYFLLNPKKHIVGFAYPPLIYPDVAMDFYSRNIQRMFERINLVIRRYFFKRRGIIFWVELEHVKRRLLELNFTNEDRVKIIHNAISPVFLNSASWTKVNIDTDCDRVSLGYLGRNYIHKNTNVLPVVKRRAKEMYGLEIDIYVTFTEKEWASCSKEFKSNIINIGPLLLTQCPSFYQSMDGIIFPSLLECFSATPLESLVMKKPIFLADRDFNRDAVGEFGIYFDPLNADDIASVLSKYYNDSESDNEILDAKNYVTSIFKSTDRMNNLYNILMLDE